MPLETASHISGLVASNPAHSDGLNQADSHIRLIKSVLLADVGSALVGGILTTPDGTPSAPAIGFAADATAGFYRVGLGEIGIAGRLVGQGTVPIGTLIDFAGTTPPTGYLVCDGQSLSTATYPELFNAIQYTWGGSGANFNLPPLQSRFTRHRDGGTYAGAVGTLQNPQNLTHTHTYSGSTGVDSNDHSHTYSGTTGTDSPDHTHNVTVGNWNNSTTGGGAFTINTGSTTVTTAGANQRHAHGFSGTTSGVNAFHTHSYSGTTSAGSADGSEARPYSATVLKCIRAL